MKKYRCSVCKTIFKRYPSQVKKGGEKDICCSRKCLWKQLGIKSKGSNNPNYRHGRCIDDKICKCGNHKDMRSKQCARCAKRGYVRKGAVPAYNLSLKVFKRIVRSCNSYVAVGKKAGVGRQFAKGMILAHNIDISHFIRSGAAGRFYKKEDLFVKSDKKRSSGMIKSYIIREKLIPYRCGKCGQGSIWKKQPLTLQLHHKDGNNKNNVIDNLEFVCPNCHSQTNTYTGRNIMNTLKKCKESGCQRGEK